MVAIMIGVHRRFRGGGWSAYASGAAVAYRDGNVVDPALRYYSIGFRLARRSGL